MLKESTSVIGSLIVSHSLASFIRDHLRPTKLLFLGLQGSHGREARNKDKRESEPCVCSDLVISVYPVPLVISITRPEEKQCGYVCTRMSTMRRGYARYKRDAA